MQFFCRRLQGWLLWSSSQASRRSFCYSGTISKCEEGSEKRRTGGSPAVFLYVCCWEKENNHHLTGLGLVWLQNNKPMDGRREAAGVTLRVRSHPFESSRDPLGLSLERGASAEERLCDAWCKDLRASFNESVCGDSRRDSALYHWRWRFFWRRPRSRDQSKVTLVTFLFLRWMLVYSQVLRWNNLSGILQSSPGSSTCQIFSILKAFSAILAWKHSAPIEDLKLCLWLYSLLWFLDIIPSITFR